MSGKVSIEKLQKDKGNSQLTENDAVFIEFINFAGTTLDELKGLTQYEHLKGQSRGGFEPNYRSNIRILVTKHELEIKFEMHQGQSADPPPFNTGTIMEARVHNNLHRVSVPFSERSAGFIWFFSFLVRFSQVKEQHGNVVILLDEPGLTLHAKAQGDLLRYITEKLQPIIRLYTQQHSPFMVPPDK